MAMTDLIVDLFAGGGGASVGLEAALGRSVDIAINHDPVALAVHRANHPSTRHLEADIWEVKPREATGGHPVDVLWASPDCKHFSRAKGSKPREQGIRSLAWVVVGWARETSPAAIFVENVPEFLSWGPLDSNGRPVVRAGGAEFLRWRDALADLGYALDWRALRACDFGAPTTRKRLFVVARRDGLRPAWPDPTHGVGLLPFRTAADCIDWSISCPSIFGRSRPLAKATLERVAEGVRRFVFGQSPLLVRRAEGGLSAPVLIQTGYGERAGQKPRCLDLGDPLGTLVNGQKHALVVAFLAKHYGGVVGQSLSEPIGTITSVDHHSLVATLLHPVTGESRAQAVVIAGEQFIIADIGLRMLQPHELLAAQFGRFAADYDLSAARTKSAQVRLIGNSVCPEVAEAVVRANTRQRERRAA